MTLILRRASDQTYSRNLQITQFRFCARKTVCYSNKTPAFLERRMNRINGKRKRSPRNTQKRDVIIVTVMCFSQFAVFFPNADFVNSALLPVAEF